MLDLDMLTRQEMLGCLYSKRLLEKLSMINADLQPDGKIDLAEVEKGIIYAKYYHGDQRRDSGEPYYSHPLEVAFMVLDHLPRTDIIITAILHDTLEDTSLTIEKITKAFGPKIAEQVYNLTRVKENGVKISSAQMVEELLIQNKYDVLLIKLFDRIHNMQTIQVKSAVKVDKIVQETLKDFLIIAVSMGKQDVEEQIRSSCLKTLFPSGAFATFSGNSFQLPSLNFQSEKDLFCIQ